MTGGRPLTGHQTSLAEPSDVAHPPSWSCTLAANGSGRLVRRAVCCALSAPGYSAAPVLSVTEVTRCIDRVGGLRDVLSRDGGQIWSSVLASTSRAAPTLTRSRAGHAARGPPTGRRATCRCAKGLEYGSACNSLPSCLCFGHELLDLLPMVRAVSPQEAVLYMYQQVHNWTRDSLCRTGGRSGYRCGAAPQTCGGRWRRRPPSSRGDSRVHVHAPCS